MTFQPAVPVEKVLKEIHKRAYVLPAIQREFVWGTGQVLMLFDSLLRGYPIGSYRSVASRNRILDAAWAQFPWNEAARERAAAQEGGGDT